MNHFRSTTRSHQKISVLAVILCVILSACAPMSRAQKALNAPAIIPTANSVSPVVAPAAVTSTPTPVPQPTQPPAAMPTAVATSPAIPTATGATTLPLEAKKNPKLGKILATAAGMTLYTFAKDSAGVSTCTTSPCTDYWPALTVSATPTAELDVKGPLGTISRPDGSMQVTFNGMPLYTFALDKAPGDANGNGVNQYGGVWHVVSLGSAPRQNPPSGGGMGGGPHY